MSLEDEVLAEIRPTEAEKRAVGDAVEALLERLTKTAREADIPAKPLLVGSVDKDTFLKDPEIDAFVAFPPDVSRKDLERWGLQLGEVLERRERRYAEHPYTRGWFHGYEAEVVPCYKLPRPTDRMTAVDRTPFHSAYVKERMESGQRDQVRLLKQFTEGVGVYGAEARVQGLSGYLCELLVLKFGSFRGVLEAGADWRPPVHLELDRPAQREFPEPFVLVDPVDGRRNVASAVSLESLATFVLAAKEYLGSPRRAFFFPPSRPPLDPAALQALLEERGTALVVPVAAAPDEPEDVVYPQLRKAEEAVVAHLEGHEFRVLRSVPFLDGDEWGLLLELVTDRLPPVRKHEGPPVWMEQAHDFLEKWTGVPARIAGPYVEGERLMVDLRREATDAGEVLRRDLPSLSLGKNLDETVQRNFRVLDGRQAARECAAPLTAFLLPGLPWVASPRRSE